MLGCIFNDSLGWDVSHVNVGLELWLSGCDFRPHSDRAVSALWLNFDDYLISVAFGFMFILN